MTGINLLPKELKEERKRAQINFKVSAICFGFIFIFILGLVEVEVANQILAINIKTAQDQIKWQEEEIAVYKDIDRKAKAVNEILALLENLEKNQILWSKILKDLAASTPSLLQITSLNVSSKTSPNFSFSGTAASRSEIVRFKEKLETSSYFSNIELLSSDRAESQKGVVFNFKIQAEFENKR